LTVTRWIDVGEATTPLSAEWAALIQQQPLNSDDDDAAATQRNERAFVMPGQATVRHRFLNINLDTTSSAPSSAPLYNDTATTYWRHDRRNEGIESIRAMEQCSKSLSHPAVFSDDTPRPMQQIILGRFFGSYAETEESMLQLRTTLTWKIPRAPYMQGTGETTRDENGVHWTSQRDRPYGSSPFGSRGRADLRGILRGKRPC